MLVTLGGAKSPDMEPFDDETLTIDNTLGGIGLTAAKLTAEVCAVYLHFVSGPINWSVSGNAPTTSVGWPAFDGDILQMGRRAAINWKGIRAGVTNGNVYVTYFRAR